MNALNIDNLQALSKQQVEAMTNFASTLTKGMQELATETADFSKHSLTTSAETVQKLFGAKSIETAIQIQTDYAKSAYEGFMARSTKINEMVGKIASEAFKPMRDAAAAVTPKA
jgi:phasin family protein